MAAAGEREHHGEEVRNEEVRNYDRLYQDFNSPLMQQIRAEAYGKDIGQHSWVSAEELEQHVARLNLSPASRLLDLGCGPGGLLAFVVEMVRCHGIGVDLSAEAITAARARASAAMGLDELIAFQVSDLNQPLPFADHSLNAVMSMDVVLHLRDRRSLFCDVARLLSPGGRFLFTDAGVISGPVSDAEIRLRSSYGSAQFVPPGCNEQLLEGAGFRLIEQVDATAGLLKNAEGRRAARLAHRTELERLEGNAAFETHQRYLETVISLGERRTMSRNIYLAEFYPR
jgi:SAM-dependent methyltransferase